MNYGIKYIGPQMTLKLDVDTAFDQAGILAKLYSGSPQRLVEEVARIKNRLKLAREYSVGWQILSDGKAQRRVVVFHRSLIWIDTGGGEPGIPSIHRGYFCPGRIHIGLKASSNALE